MATIDTGLPSTSSLLNPGTYFTIGEASSGNTASISDVLIIGQAIIGGTATPDPVIAASPSIVAATYGQGSMIAQMYQRYRLSDPATRVWLLPLADAPGSTAGTCTVVFNGSPTVAETYSIYVNSYLISIGAPAGQSPSVAATNLANAVNANVTFACTASVSNNTVTLTAKNAGLIGGDISCWTNLAGPAAGELTPFGTSVSVSHTAGSTDPDLVAALDAIGEMPFDVFVSPYNNAVAANAFEALLNDSTGRWNYVKQAFGFAFAGIKGTLSSIAAEAETVNTRFMSVLEHNSTEPVWLVAAAYASACAVSLSDDPALPLQNVTLNIAPAPHSQVFGFSDRNTLLGLGISTVRQDKYGTVVLERAVTLNKTNNLGIADTTFQNVEMLFTSAYVIRRFKAVLSVAFARKKLVADGTRITQGTNFVTSRTVLAMCVAVYQALAEEGIVSDPKTFNANIAAENQGGGRVALYLPIVEANQLRQIAMRCILAQA